MSLQSNYPIAQGLYNPANEHDACGVAMVATLNKVATHSIVAKGLTALRNLEHRGASGAEPDSGDGAGILICIPDAFYRAILPFELPAEGAYATGIGFIEPSAEVKDSIVKISIAHHHQEKNKFRLQFLHTANPFCACLRECSACKQLQEFHL